MVSPWFERKRDSRSRAIPDKLLQTLSEHVLRGNRENPEACGSAVNNPGRSPRPTCMATTTKCRAKVTGVVYLYSNEAVRSFTSLISGREQRFTVRSNTLFMSCRLEKRLPLVPSPKVRRPGVLSLILEDGKLCHMFSPLTLQSPQSVSAPCIIPACRDSRCSYPECRSPHSQRRMSRTVVPIPFSS